LRQKVFDRLKTISKINKEATSYAVLYRLKGKNGSWRIYVFSMGRSVKVLEIKKIFTNAIYLTKATIY